MSRRASRVAASLLLALLGTGCLRATRAPDGARATGEERFVDSLLAAMTLEEKLGQLSQLSADGMAGDTLATLIRRRC